MKYFIDTEFIEGFHKPFLGKRRHFIDLISIGIVAEDGRTFSAVSNGYSYKDADNWVKENVIIPLYIDTVDGDARNWLDARNFHKTFGLSNKQIADRIYTFCLNGETTQPMGIGNPYEPVAEFYGYYADYDWVLFCSLFGRMINLPKGFPMYCRDLKQMLDEKAENLSQIQLTKFLVEKNDNWVTTTELPRAIVNIDDFSKENKVQLIKGQSGYPKQENEHNALADAQWNKKLYDFINSL